jgi:hypothetical protein
MAGGRRRASGCPKPRALPLFGASRLWLARHDPPVAVKLIFTAPIGDQHTHPTIKQAADPARGLLVGATAVGGQAEEWVAIVIDLDSISPNDAEFLLDERAS